MKLKSFGCSFIYGSDLSDLDRLRPLEIHSRLTWPALLAESHGWLHSCYARPGAGNLEITERLLSALVDANPAVYVINWTWIDRLSYTDTQDLWYDSPWKSIMPTDTDARAVNYYRNIHSELRDKITTLMNIKLAIDSLKEHGHKFIMTYMDDLIFDQQWNTTPAVIALQNYCKPHMTQFDGQNFLNWSRTNGHKISPRWHPLESAHRAGFELIKSYNLV